MTQPDSAGPSALPTWEEFMVPILRVLGDGEQRQLRIVFADVKDHLALTDEQRAETVSSGQSKAENRIGWALSALTRAEALVRPARGHYLLTDSGRDLLAKHGGRFRAAELEALPAYQAYIPRSHTRGPGADPSTSPTPALAEDDSTPREQIEAGVERIHTVVAADLLERLRGHDPAFLEQSVLDLLVAMGYGGTERAQRVGGTGDGGVDGVIDQDALGLDRIYVQAKRYAADNTIGRETIQAFVGARHGHGATRGVFITTSAFSPQARDYATGIPSRVILIDGGRLASLMIQYRVGVQVADTFDVVEVDEDYFT